MKRPTLATTSDSGKNRLDTLLSDGAVDHPTQCAVRWIDQCGQNQSWTYGQLDSQVGAWSDLVRPYCSNELSTVVWCAQTTPRSLCALLGIVRLGLAYVPVDPKWPMKRVLSVLTQLGPTLAVVDQQTQSRWEQEEDIPPLRKLQSLDPGELTLLRIDSPPSLTPIPAEVSSILFTSGSTGAPKGVMHTDASVREFVDAAKEYFRLPPGARFAALAPLHFDLSTLEIFGALKCGGVVTLFPAGAVSNPLLIAEHLESQQTTLWYTTPTMLRLLLRFGKLGGRRFNHLTHLLVAGEPLHWDDVEPIRKAFPNASFFNLYGPTETNVCTWYELDFCDSKKFPNPPIGVASGNYKCRLEEPADEVGSQQLLVDGPGLMAGYLGHPSKSHLKEQSDGTVWYPTGDWVRLEPNGRYVFVGRKDRMVKRRGVRVELGEIEHALRAHPRIENAAVVAYEDPTHGARLVAHVATQEDLGGYQLREYCSGVLPAAMIPDEVRILAQLPLTSNTKIDYEKLAESEPPQ